MSVLGSLSMSLAPERDYELASECDHECAGKFKYECVAECDSASFLCRARFFLPSFSRRSSLVYV